MASTVLTHRDRSPLTRDEMMRAVPSVFADAPHESRSRRYLYVPTVAILDLLRGEGYEPVWASEQRARDEARRGFTKHMVRLAPNGGAPLTTIGDVRPEIVLTNSHDGSSSVALAAGVFRLVCSNGMVVGDLSQSFKVQHSAKYAHDVIEGTYRVVGDLSGPVAEQVDAMQHRELTRPEQILLAEHATSLRWQDREAPVTPEQMLTTRRQADREPSAWNTLNVLQENMIRGGLPYARRNEQGRIVGRGTTRTVTGIDDTLRLNRGIWDAVATLTTGNRVDLAAEMFGRLSASERAQLAMRFA